MCVPCANLNFSYQDAEYRSYVFRQEPVMRLDIGSSFISLSGTPFLRTMTPLCLQDLNRSQSDAEDEDTNGPACGLRYVHVKHNPKILQFALTISQKVS